MKKIWKYKLEKPVRIKTRITGVNFENKFCKIEENGFITGKTGFAWDGCTPKWEILDFMIGTPDGTIDPETGKAKTYYGSLLHDILYQFAPRKKVKRKQADLVFLDEMEKTDYKWRKVYYYIVRIFGNKWWKKYSRE